MVALTKMDKTTFINLSSTRKDNLRDLGLWEHVLHLVEKYKDTGSSARMSPRRLHKKIYIEEYGESVLLEIIINNDLVVSRITTRFGF